MTPDARFFRDHPDATCRVRAPVQGEVDELAAHMLPAGVKWDDGFVLPPSHVARVMVIRLPQRRTARVLASVPVAAVTEEGPFALTTIAVGDRLAIA